jgi:hypothetical protein
MIVAEQIERPVLFKDPRLPFEHLLDQAIHDLDSGQIALMNGPVEGLSSESLLVKAAVGMPVEITTVAALKLEQNLRSAIHEDPRELLLVQKASGMDCVFEMTVDRILRVKNRVVSTLNEPGAPPLTEQRFYDNGDIKIRRCVVSMDRGEKSRSSAAKDKHVCFNGLV